MLGHFTWSFPGKRSWSQSKENMDTRHQISHVPSLEHDANPSQVLQRCDDFTSKLVSEEEPGSCSPEALARCHSLLLQPGWSAAISLPSILSP